VTDGFYLQLFLHFPPIIPSIDKFLPTTSAPRSTSRTELEVNPLSSVGTGIITSTPTPALRKDRPALVVSSTSWTADEDFSILIDAMERYEKKAESAKGKLPKMMVLVTGKGPLRDKYMKDILEREVQEEWKWVRCRTVWLEASDYPLLLGGCVF
jgi:beta-1,4-mannosyltransferase